MKQELKRDKLRKKKGLLLPFSPCKQRVAMREGRGISAFTAIIERKKKFKM